MSLVEFFFGRRGEIVFTKLDRNLKEKYGMGLSDINKVLLGMLILIFGMWFYPEYILPLLKGGKE